jgi:hypothetical protein
MNIQAVITSVLAMRPDTIKSFSGEFLKTYNYMLRVIEGLVRGVYSGTVGGQFVDALGNLIVGQITQAFRQAYEDEGYTDFFPPEYLENEMQAEIQKHANFDFVYQYYKDIVDARVDGTPIEPLIARAALWAARYNEAYNTAVAVIARENGGKLIWQLGATEQHCESCAGLNGIVAFASEWDLAGVKPQSAPNDALECGGWRCDCSLTTTDKRRTRGAFDRIMSARM